MAVNYFLKVDGIEGESVVKGFEKQIQLLSFSWGGSQQSSVGHGGGSGAGKVDLADFSVMKHFDKASTPMFKALCTGTHIKTGSLAAVKAGATKAFLQIDLKELFVTSLQVSASNENPTESVSFSFNEIKTTYSTQNDQGILTPTASHTYNTGTGENT